MADEPAPAKRRKTNKSVERIYQKYVETEAILLNPYNYIGSVKPVTQPMWVFDEGVGMNSREITFVPGLYKIFDEILVNAADNKQRDKNMDSIKIEINPNINRISIWNNGQGIPVVELKDEKMFIPSLIFGYLRTSSNFENKEPLIGGRYGYGAKLCNIFSTKFTVETLSNKYKKSFKQTWAENISKPEDPEIIEGPFKESDFTRVTFYPDLAKFNMTELDKDTVALMTRRAYDIAGCTKGIEVYLNDVILPVGDFRDYIQLYLKNEQDENVVYEEVNEHWEIAVTMSDDDDFQQVSFVNSVETTNGGTHVDYITNQLTSKIAEHIKKQYGCDDYITPFEIKSHLWVFVNCLIKNPTFNSQKKEYMTSQIKNFGSTCQLTDVFVYLLRRSGVVKSIMS